MPKIMVLAVVGLGVIGSLGWALGNQQRHLDLQPVPAHVPAPGAATGQAQIEPAMLFGWMERRDQNCLIVDLRAAEHYDRHHLWRAINRRYDDLIDLQSLRRLPRHRSIVIYADDSEQAAAAAGILRLAGLTAFYLPMTQHAWNLLSTIGPADGPTTGDKGLRLAHKARSATVNHGPFRAVAGTPVHGSTAGNTGMVAGAKREALVKLGFLGAD